MEEKSTILRGHDRDIIGRYADFKLNDQLQSIMRNSMEVPYGVRKETFGELPVKTPKMRKKTVI